MKIISWIALVLVVIGGLNWGLWGLFESDLVAYLFGSLSVVSRVIYVLIGLAAIFSIFAYSKCWCGSCPVHSKSSGSGPTQM